MFRKTSIFLLIIVQLLFSPVWGLGRAWAIPQPPESPTAPSAPDAPETPSAPEAPEAPEAPTTPEAPTAPDVPVNNQDIPIAPEAPTQNQTTENEETDSTNQVETSTTDSQNTTTDGQTATNDNTGANSDNHSSVENNQDTTINTDNDAEIDNDLVLTSDSGGNEVDKNTGNAMIKTGDATVEGLIENQANQTVTSVVGCNTCSSAGGSAANSQTGANSDNQAEVDINSDTLIENNNTADLDTGVIAIADSGHNSADKNTGNVEIETGDANIGLTIVNVANTDISGVETSEYDVYDDHRGDIVIDFSNPKNSSGGSAASNSQTGAESNNQAEVDNNTSLTMVNNNDATVANDLVLDAISGENSADKNTGNVDIATGDANVVANVVNLVNNTIESGTEILVATVNIFGNLVGDIILAPLANCGNNCQSSDQFASNSKTGADSNNEAGVGIQRLNATMQHNEANIYNGVTINANTGDNEANRNTLGGSVETGNVNVQAEEITVANNNMIGSGEDTWWVVIVNEAGQWVGKILGAGDDDHVAVVDTIALGAVNNTTGANSNNQANVEQNSNTVIEQNNTANVTNNVVINANTGGNSAEDNTGNASITTGDVNIYQNVVNYVNNNIVGGKVVITFVNVFGSWIGDVVTPGHEKQVATNNSNNEDPENNQSPSDSDDQSRSLAIGGLINDFEEESNIDNSSEADNQNESQNDDDESENDDWLDTYSWLNLSNSSTFTTIDQPQNSRILAGTWLREEDPYLQTTPAPSAGVQSMAISDGKAGWTKSDKNLVYLFLVVSPIGLIAARFKKRFLVN